MKKRINLLKVITFVLICTIIFNLPVVRATTASVNTEKIDKELLELINSTKSNDTIPVAIWFDEIDAEKIENDVKAAVNINRQSISDNFSAASDRKATSERYTNADVDKYIETERALYSKAQTESHHAFIEKHDWLQTNKRGSDEKKIKFVSKYAPMIIAELTVNEILSLSKDENVEKLYTSSNEKDVTFSNIANSITQADYVRDTNGYTGNGIKIGMIEPGEPHLVATCINGQNIIYNTNEIRDYTTHATYVAAILVGNSLENNGVTYQGVVPDATLYSASYDGTVNEWYHQMEWLLSKGVHVINMSAGSDRPVANYSTRERWLDHLAINHSVHFVISAGNLTEDVGSTLTVSDPALAYNVITVGNMNDHNTIYQSDDTLAPSSCYIEHNGNNKPDLIAPGTDIRYEVMTLNGTSFAAPQVAAIVAQLCERQPSLKTNQAAMKAILTASINHTRHAYTTAEEDENQYDKYGAGVVNAREAITTINYSRYASSSFPAYNPAGSTHSYTFNVATLDTNIRVSLSWLQYSSLPNDHVTSEQHANPNTIILGDLSDLCLKVYDPNGNQVAYSDNSANNTEIAQFEPTIVGNYTIKVTNGNVSDETTYYGLAWYY